MTDRELLEKAAKAAGIEIGWIDPVWNNPDATPYIHLPGGKLWNPLLDDGDALRLAVRLGIDVQQFESGYVEAWKHPHQSCTEDHGLDPCAATRRAIVRAAAAMEE